jgi:hypothetical protein
MAERYDAVISRKDKDGKTRYTKIGAAFPAKGDKGGFNIVLDALPMPNAEGQAWISLYVPKDSKDAPNNRVIAAGGGQPTRVIDDNMDDSIPF